MGREWLGCGRQLLAQSPSGAAPEGRFSTGVSSCSDPWLVPPPKAANSQQHQGLCVQPRLRGHRGSLGGLAVLARLGLLMGQSSPGLVRGGAGGLQTRSRVWHSPREEQHSGSPIPKGISAGQGFDVASSS